MQVQVTLRLTPAEAANDAVILEYLAAAVARSINEITGFYPLRHSIDARGRAIWVDLVVLAFVNEPALPRALETFTFKDVRTSAHRVIIVGAGPAGLFAALQCLEFGIKPLILERGKDVRERRRDLAAINKSGIVHPESNYCFGEGGAGTYSDGKLYTRSNKRGNLQRILQLFVHFGADENILYHTHPHIGTNKLPQIITRLRQQIIDAGGEVWFNTKVTQIIVENAQATGVKTADGLHFEGVAIVLATGHSARDVFNLLHEKSIDIEAKPFALGVRVEHPQEIIDRCQYHLPASSYSAHLPFRGEYLPPAAYSFVHQTKERGVFSFCMCPGGIIAPAATAPGEIVVNGWSPSKRNNPMANSGLVVEIKPTDLAIFTHQFSLPAIDPLSPLSMLALQQWVEQRSFAVGGGQLIAPAQRVEDFLQKKTSTDLPNCSYQPGITSVNLSDVFPQFIVNALQEGLIAFGKKMKGYRTNEAVLVATESRTSSPVRIPRNFHSLEHIQVKRLYPCAEGAGYAGGIISAAMDGERVVKAIAVQLGIAN